MLIHDVTITLALTDEDRAEAVEFIETFMRKSFNCDPPPTTGIIFIAKRGGQIVGSIVLAGNDGEIPFAIEAQYTFEPRLSPFPFVRAYIIQGSRWINSLNRASKVSEKLLLTSFRLAYDFGKRYMLIEAKPYSVNHLRQLGIECFPLEGVVLREDVVREIVGDGGMKYFIEKPQPTLYILELLPSIKVLSRAKTSL